MDHADDTHRDQAGAEGIRSATVGLVADGAAHLGAERFATATEQVLQDAVRLENLCLAKARVDLGCRQGTAFECIETLKFNRAAARAGSPPRAKLTCFDAYRSPADIEIWHDTELVRRVQCKSRLTPAQTLRDLADPKYHGMGRLGPADQAESITKMLDRRVRQDTGNIYGRDYRDVDEHFMNALAHDEIASGGTTRAEAERAAEAPGTAAVRFAVGEAMREVSDAARKGAIAGAVVGGTLSGADNLRAWRRGNTPAFEALIATGKATASAGGRGAIVAAGARVITIDARRAGLTRFASGSGPAAVAAAAIDIGGMLNRHVRGNISPDELRDESVNILAGAAFSTYCGIACRNLIPVPVAGALIGSLVGTVVSGLVLEAAALGTSARDRARRARVAEVEAASVLATAELDRHRTHMIELAREHKRALGDLLPLFDATERAFVIGDPRAATPALTALGSAFDCELPFATREDFDALAAKSSATLVI